MKTMKTFPVKQIGLEKKEWTKSKANNFLRHKVKFLFPEDISKGILNPPKIN
jgi:hypothetical protein